MNIFKLVKDVTPKEALLETYLNIGKSTAIGIAVFCWMERETLLHHEIIKP